MFRFLLFALIFKYGSTVTTHDCPQGLSRNKYLQVFGDSCYLFNMKSSLDYTHATRACRKAGGHLALVKTKTVNDFLTRELVNTYGAIGSAWIGLNDKDTETHFEWEDGTPLNPETDYSNFASKEGPRTSTFQGDFEDCVALDPSTGKWMDYHCDTEYFIFREDKHYICEYTPIMPTTPMSKESMSTEPVTSTSL